MDLVTRNKSIAASKASTPISDTPTPIKNRNIMVTILKEGKIILSLPDSVARKGYLVFSFAKRLSYSFLMALIEASYPGLSLKIPGLYASPGFRFSCKSN